MDTLADRTADVSDDQVPQFDDCLSPSSDVPGMLAGHVCDVYAAEERERRRRRTERMIALARTQH